jgi:flagellar hook-basal body complex protein FliE
MKISKKKYMVLNLALAVQHEELEKNKLILTTAIGVIVGTPEIPKDDGDAESKSIDESSSSQSIAIKLIDVVSKNYKEATGVEEEAKSESDGFILLKDVTIKSSSAQFNLPVLAVFYDQIIGVTIGNI